MDSDLDSGRPTMKELGPHSLHKADQVFVPPQHGPQAASGGHPVVHQRVQQPERGAVCLAGGGAGEVAAGEAGGAQGW